MRLSGRSLLAAVVVASLSTAVHADGDAAAGKGVFTKFCSACHFADQDKKKVGPPLLGVFGRTAGSWDGFKYSKNIVEEGQAGLTWDDENLSRYLRNPKDLLPKGTMAFAGLKSDEDVANVIAYLKADPKP